VTISLARREALAVLALCTAMNILSRGAGESFAVFLLPVAAEFGADRAALTGVYATAVLVAGLVAPFVGVAIDRLGPRRCYLAGLLLFGGAYALAGQVAALWQLYVVIGVLAPAGASLVGMVPASTLVSRWFGDRLPTAMAVLSAAMGTGMLAFAPLAQWLIDRVGWRHAYELIGLALLVLLVPLALLPWSRIAAGSADVVEAMRRRGAGQAAWTVARALRTPIFWALAGMMFSTAVSTYVVSVQLVACLVDAGYPPLVAAWTFGLAGMISIAGMMGAAALAERVGERLTATVSYSLTLLGLALLGLALVRPSGWLVAGYVLAFGGAQGSRGPLAAVLAARGFPGAMGRVYGMVLLAAGAGSALGAWAGGALFDLTGGYHAGLALSALGALGGLALFWTVPALGGRRPDSLTGA
jgi:MFS family permease